ncbi:heterogeneous nuclear ribonucleoprotein F-like [Babylonia areolata]|uniref:heterogeneous nuclear ribonucleoprotein F-like n=1 Tax=Babylonia areolata TaxID=304850 RepID=UPI003FD469BD
MEDDGFCVRLRGLPWSASPDDVLSFFNESQIMGGKAGIYLTQSKEGRPSGHAFVEFVSEDDLQRALKKNKEHLGNRYIEVFRCKKSEMDWVVKRGGMDNNSLGDAIVKLRGLPFGCSKEEIAQFFTGLEIVPNGIMLPEDRLGRSTGEAFVQFASQAIAERALGKHKERIGHRYIEVFKSNLQECRAIFGNEQFGMRGPMGMGMGMGRPGPYDRNDRFGNPMAMGAMAAAMGAFGGRGRGRGNVKGFYENDFEMYSMGFSGQGGRGRGGGRGPPGSHYISKTGHSVHMRGMPFLAIEEDVLDFFAPLKPLSVQFEYGEDGRRTGGADVDFATHQEALEAMKKHRCNMQYRYIELFLNSSPNPQSGGGGYAGDMNCMGGGGAKFAGNMGGGFGMGGGGGFGSGNFGSMQGQQFSNSSNGYGMGAGSMGTGNMGGGNMGVGSMGVGNMGGGSGYGGGSGMNSNFMEGGGYNRMGGW